MQDSDRIPRWVVENDPSWEKSIDSDLGMMRWTKKGTGITAVCAPTGMYCEIQGREESSVGLTDLASSVSKMHGPARSGADDITRYLSSRYLNPGVNGPGFDLRRFRSR